jgi:large subunit ribosomal protein L9
MKVILLSDVPKVGKRYDIVDVAPGYARNFLIARSLGEVITKENGKRVADLAKKREVEKTKQTALRVGSLAKVKDVMLSFERKANEEGHLYAGISAEEIALALGTAIGVTFDADSIEIEKPIKEVGTSTLQVVIGDAKASFGVTVTAEVEA